MQRIMVVTDGSEGANRAVDVAAGLAKALNGILWIVTIRDVKLLSNHMKEIRQPEYRKICLSVLPSRF